MEDRRHHPSMHLPSRLDHLDFIMKYLEGKWSLQKGVGKEFVPVPVPVDLAMREAYFKGSLLDRVVALEHRLSQLCLELESTCSTSCTSTSTSGYASSSLGSEWELLRSSSLPTFSNLNQQNKQESQPLIHWFEIQGNPETEQQKKKSPHPPKPQNWKKRSSKAEKAYKSIGKKRVSPKWPHLRQFGC
ncbi:hypothetical protein SLE2022_225210 [Rubroshorea leprosula]